MKLAFLIAQTTIPSEGARLSIPVNLGEVGELAPHLGEPVLLFGNAQPGGGEASGQARFAALEAGLQGKRQHLAQLEIIESFPQPIALPLQTSMVRNTWRGLDDATFGDILRQVQTRSNGGASERKQAEYTPSQPVLKPLEYLGVLQAAVRLAYDDRCALTGAAHTEARPVLAFSIRPTTAGGLHQQDNCIALVESAGDALNHFHLTIGEDMEIIADLSRIDPELIETLNANGRLRLPAARAARPSTNALSWHRQQFFRRVGAV